MSLFLGVYQTLSYNICIYVNIVSKSVYHCSHVLFLGFYETLLSQPPVDMELVHPGSFSSYVHRQIQARQEKMYAKMRSEGKFSGAAWKNGPTDQKPFKLSCYSDLYTYGDKTPVRCRSL